MTRNYVEESLIDHIDASVSGTTEVSEQESPRLYYGFYRWAIEQHYQLARRFPETTARLIELIAERNGEIEAAKTARDVFLDNTGMTVREITENDDPFGGDDLREEYRILQQSVNLGIQAKNDILICLASRTFLRESRNLMQGYLSRWNAFQGERHLDRVMEHITAAFV